MKKYKDSRRTGFAGLSKRYIDIYNKYKDTGDDEIVFDIDLIRQVEVNVDYLILVEKYYDGNCDDRDTIIHKAVNASIQLRGKEKRV